MLLKNTVHLVKSGLIKKDSIIFNFCKIFNIAKVKELNLVIRTEDFLKRIALFKLLTK